MHAGQRTADDALGGGHVLDLVHQREAPVDQLHAPHGDYVLCFGWFFVSGVGCVHDERALNDDSSPFTHTQHTRNTHTQTTHQDDIPLRIEGLVELGPDSAGGQRPAIKSRCPVAAAAAVPFHGGLEGERADVVEPELPVLVGDEPEGVKVCQVWVIR